MLLKIDVQGHQEYTLYTYLHMTDIMDLKTHFSKHSFINERKEKVILSKTRCNPVQSTNFQRSSYNTSNAYGNKWFFKHRAQKRDMCRDVLLTFSHFSVLDEYLVDKFHSSAQKLCRSNQLFLVKIVHKYYTYIQASCGMYITIQARV